MIVVQRAQESNIRMVSKKGRARKPRQRLSITEKFDIIDKVRSGRQLKIGNGNLLNGTYELKPDRSILSRPTFTNLA